MSSSILSSTISVAILLSSTLALPHVQQSSLIIPAPRIPSEWVKQSSASQDSSMTFQIHLKSNNEAGLEAKMEEIVALDGKWLTSEQLKGYVQPSAESLDTVMDYLKKHGIAEESVCRNSLGHTLTVNSKVQNVEKMFGTKLWNYGFQDGSEDSIKAHDFTLSREIAGHIVNVNLNSFGNPKRSTTQPIEGDETLDQATVERLATKSSSSKAAIEACDPNGVTPDCLRKLYGTYSYAGSSSDPSIAIMGYGGEYVSQKDLTYFSQHLRQDAANYKIPVVKVHGGINNASDPGSEAMLDVESVIGLAYPIPSTFYSFGKPNEQGDIYSKTFQYFLDKFSDQDRPKSISISYGDEEEFYTQAQSESMCSLVKQLASLGTTVVVASGDYGVAINGDETCPPFRVDFISACPYAVSVGATANFNPEEATSRFYSSGGFSNHFATPSYQKSAVSGYLKQLGNMDKGDYNRTGRAFPDLSAQGDASVVRVRGKWVTIGGTSASCPEVAAFVGLLNSARKQAGKGPVGWFNPTIYKSAGAFNDISKGGAYGCDKANKLGFPSVQGYDPVTGLGTPNFGPLRAAFGA